MTLSDIGVNVGIVAGYAAGLLFSGFTPGESWRLICMLGLVGPFLIFFVVVGILPETPRWFVLNGRDEEARQVLTDIYPEGKILFSLYGLLSHLYENFLIALHVVFEKGSMWIS